MTWRLHSVVRQYAQLTKQKLIPRNNASVKVRPDPFSQVAPELAQIKSGLTTLLGAGHPALDQVAKYYFSRPSKHLRPLLILLFSQATNGLGTNWSQKLSMSHGNGAGGSLDALDRAFTRSDVLNDWNPCLPDKTSPFKLEFSWHPPSSYFQPPLNSHMEPISLADPPVILPTQLRLAQIVEMIHAASLLHDDVIDQSSMRRGAPSAPVAFGSKFAVLGGDFILGRASSALARLGDPEVIELIATVIANLVEGEILQMKDAFASDSSSLPSKNPWALYMQKTYLKTASLMAKGARGAVVLGGCLEGEVYRDIAYSYGRDLGLAFQLVDDIMDYESSEVTMGKPGGADLQLGLATGPVLYAWEEYPELGPLIERKFEKPGDVELARELVRRSSGLERTRTLALAYAKQAQDVLQPLPDSNAKLALEALADRVVNRKS